MKSNDIQYWSKDEILLAQKKVIDDLHSIEKNIKNLQAKKRRIIPYLDFLKSITENQIKINFYDE